jgi:cation/acetate symporter
LALPRLTLITETVAWAFSLAAATFFPVLVLGIFWKRCNATGAITGMIGGLLTTITYIIISRFGPSIVGATIPPSGKPTNLMGNIVQIVYDSSTEGAFGRLQIFGVFHTAAGIFGLIICFSLAIIVSLITKSPDMQTQRFVESLRRPTPNKR